MLPVMNSKNEPIPIEGRTFKDKYGKDKTEKVDAFNVNSAIMRCMTKALALHGLGLYIYAGEDLPEEEEKKVEKKVEEKTTKAPKTDGDIELFAKSVIEYVVLAKTQSGLKSYWVANQEQLDELKSNRPELYATVVESFKAAKAALGE
jgi:precorrin-4 methylase